MRIHLIPVVLALVLPLACGGGGGGSDDGPAAFVVAQIVPFEGADDIPLREEINIVFTRPVLADSLTPDSIQVVNEDNVEVIGERRLSQFNAAIVRFIPLQDYEADELHRVIVNEELLDEDGNPLETGFLATFRTEPEPPNLPGPQQTENLGNRMVLGRWFHRMTPIGTNRILVTGGYGSDSLVRNRAESFFVASRQAQLIDQPMRQARAGHVQIPLLDGRILLAGGESDNNPFTPLRQCEIFDPNTNTFAEAGSMEFARSFASGNRLPDGRVLVTGGQSLDGGGTFIFRDDAEIYNPQTNTWTTLTTAMNRGRAAHASTTLANGDVILLGGSSSVANADRFHISTLDFAAAPPPNFPHFFAASTTLDDGTFVVAGGSGSNGVTIFQEDIGFVGGLNTLPAQRIFATATAFADGRVVIVGGFNSAVVPALIHSTIDVFVPDGASGRVFRAPNFRLPVPTSHHDAARDSFGAIWIAGGLPLDIGDPALRQVTIIHPE